MQISDTPISGLKVIEPRVFEDDRGYFFESYNEEAFAKIGLHEKFVQDNQSFSTKGVIRGLHFQSPPFDQGKLVRVVSGKVLDIAVDIRKDSSTFGKWYGIELSAENGKMFYIPPGFAHGFSALEDAIFLYKCTHVYHKASEHGIVYNDPDLDIDWQVKDSNVSEKDLVLSRFKDIVSPF